MTRRTKSETEIARMTRKLVALHAECTPAELAAGLAWYERAQSAARAMAGTSPVERAASVVAHLSPRCTWAVNVAWATRMLDAADRGQECPRVSVGRQRAKAWAAACGGDPAAGHGPKTGAFYRNILGDADAVCVDSWAARAAGHASIGHGRKSLGPALYGRVAAAYKRAAAALGMAPRDLQAAIWVHVRGAAD